MWTRKTTYSGHEPHINAHPMVHQIVDRCHVSWSNRRVLKYFISRMEKGYKTWRILPKGERRRWMRQAFSVHKENRELYRYVMYGHLK